MSNRIYSNSEQKLAVTGNLKALLRNKKEKLVAPTKDFFCHKICII
jgi:hypothetical protein